MPRKIYRKTSWISPKVEQRNSPFHGLGLFAKEFIPGGEIVIIWGGHFVTDGAEANNAEQHGKAVQQLDKNLWDVFDYATRNDDPSYNHNHSCDPNTWMNDEVTISARRDIQKAEELTIDYAMFVLDDAYVLPGQCQCGSALCRHNVTGRDWQRKDLQQRYAGHFSPYLNRRMSRSNPKR